MRLVRLFQLLDELRLRRTAVSAQRLAIDMGVSVRTVYRDIADLQALGAPIRGEGGVGYLLEPGLFMPSLRLNEDELSALALGVRMVAARTDPDMAEAARRAAAKIASAVGEGARLEFLDSSFEAGPSGVANTPYFGVLRDAIRQRRVLEIRYTSLADKVSTRLARPLGLTVFDSIWLATIWCETAHDFRHLRIDRIVDVRITAQQFLDERGRRFSDCLAREGKNGLSFAGKPTQQSSPANAKRRRG